MQLPGLTRHDTGMIDVLTGSAVGVVDSLAATDVSVAVSSTICSLDLILLERDEDADELCDPICDEILATSLLAPFESVEFEEYSANKLTTSKCASTREMTTSSGVSSSDKSSSIL